MFNYTAICRQCREYLVNVVASEAASEDISEHAQTTEDISEPAQIPEATCSQTGQQEYTLQEESHKWPQEEVTTFFQGLIISRFMCYGKVMLERHEFKASHTKSDTILKCIHVATLKCRKRMLVLHLTN